MIKARIFCVGGQIMTKSSSRSLNIVVCDIQNDALAFFIA